MKEDTINNFARTAGMNQAIASVGLKQIPTQII